MTPVDPGRDLWRNTEFEVLPFKSVLDQAPFLPAGAVVSVTSSPARGLAQTIRYAAGLAQRGFEVVPHLAARGVKDEAHLMDLLDSIAAAGMRRAFVVGGDNQDAGAFADALSLLRAMKRADRPMPRIGIAAYPDGHATIPDDALLQALRDKQPYASYMSTQMCFDAQAIERWVRQVRTEGITLPIHLGMPAVAPIQRLLAISAQIGVKASARYLSKHRGLLARVLRPRAYTPARLTEQLGPLIADPSAGIEAVHFFTFNQVETCEAWRREYIGA